MKVWQKCPKCNGQGRVGKPSYVAGDQLEWSGTSTNHVCNVCNGQMIIPTPDQHIDITDLIFDYKSTLENKGG